MDKRPYFSKTVDELENIFEENIKDRAILIELQKELSYRSRVRSKELAKKVKAILDAPYQLDLPIDIQISGEYDRTATWYGTIGWYENRVDEFKNDKNELQKILYTLLSWNFDDRTYNLIIKIQNILYQNHGLLIQYAQQTEYKLKNYKNIIENRDKIPLCNNKNQNISYKNLLQKNEEPKINYWITIPLGILFIVVIIFAKDIIPGVSTLEAFCVAIVSMLIGALLPPAIGYLFWKDKGEIRYYLLALLGFFCLSPAIGELLLYCLDIIRQFLK